MGEKHRQKAIARIIKEANLEIKKTRQLIKKNKKKIQADKVSLLETDIIALETAIAKGEPKEVLAKEERLVKARDRSMPFLNKSVVREYAEAIAIAVVLAMFIRTFIIQAFKIPSGSMEDTLLVGDHLLVNKFIYGVKIPFIEEKIGVFNKPERGDIIVFKYPVDDSKDFIKRVIAVGGDKVEVKNKKVFINNEPIESESYAVFKAGDTLFSGFPKGRNFGPVDVPEGHLFVMGDNRDNSHDSRFWGTVDLNEVKGKAFILYWSWDRTNKRIRFSRIGDLIR